MSTIYKQVPLYRFLEHCNQLPGEEKKKILDCGAGGACPPLGLFKSHGYETAGIDLDPEQVNLANAFGKANGFDLNVQIGDMTQLPFESGTFDAVYSYNSIFHMKKVDIAKSVSELIRVLKPGGLMFVNFLSTDDFRCGEGPNLGNHQYEQMDDEPVIHSYFDYDEAEEMLADMAFVIKERRVIERIYEGDRIRQGFIDYIVRKPLV